METSITPQMRLAWFRAHTEETVHADRRTPLVDALRSSHTIDVFHEASAHDFVWKQFRDPYDLAVYELDNTAQHQFIWPYLFHYPGLLWLRTNTLHGSRAAELEQQHRLDDYAAEFAFNHGRAPVTSGRPRFVGRGEWPMLRAPLVASKMVVVSQATMAALLALEYPEARIRHVPPGIERPGTSNNDGREIVVFGVVGRPRLSIERALERARLSGANAQLYGSRSVEELTEKTDVVVACDWPSTGEPLTTALAGMAAGKPVIVFETDETAGWQALDPQTWRPRGFGESRPMVLSIDARDEEHSLTLAIRRLAEDAALRAELGAAGHDWWRAHATMAHTVTAWNQLFTAARSAPPPAYPPGWPRHLTADGTELARKLLAEFDQEFDLLIGT